MNIFELPEQPLGPESRITGYWLDGNGGYYEGDRLEQTHISVTRRPSPDYDWQNGVWVQNTNKAALHQINLLEQAQAQRLTPRALREFILGVMATTGFTNTPAFTALKAIDDQIKVERARL